MVSKKNRKKQNFLNKVKKGAEHGNYGRGENIKEDEYNFFMSITEKVKKVNEVEKDELITSFFREFTSEGGSRFIRNQIVSNLADDLFPSARIESVVDVTNLLSSDLWTMCTDVFASHVLQSTLMQSIKLLQPNFTKQEYDDDSKLVDVTLTDEQREVLVQFLFKVTKYCHNNLLDFVTEKCASHVVRTVLEVCSGIPCNSSLNDKKHKSPNSKIAENCVVPEKLEGLAEKMCTRLTQLAGLADKITIECGSAVYQCALSAAKHLDNSELLSSLVSHILTHGINEVQPAEEENEEEVSLPAVFNNNATCRLLEAVIEKCSISQLSSIYSSYFADHISALSQHSIANFSVQKLLRAWQDSDSFEALSDSVVECLENVVTVKNFGVILAWCETCARLKTQQGKCITSLMSLFSCYEPEERQLKVVPCLLQLCAYDSLPGSLKVTLFGALIVQQLLNFKKPIKIINSILDMSKEELHALLTDPRGWHVAESFCTSQYVGEKSRIKLLAKLQDDPVSLAITKYGSRSLESLWSVANPKTRLSICQKLSDSSTRLKGSEFGAIIYSKFNVKMFKKADKNDWLNLEEKKAKKRKLLQESMIAPEETPTKKKKKE